MSWNRSSWSAQWLSCGTRWHHKDEQRSWKQRHDGGDDNSYSRSSAEDRSHSASAATADANTNTTANEANTNSDITMDTNAGNTTGESGSQVVLLSNERVRARSEGTRTVRWSDQPVLSDGENDDQMTASPMEDDNTPQTARTLPSIDLTPVIGPPLGQPSID